MPVEAAWQSKLQDSLTEIKILASTVDGKLDQLSVSVQKLESGFEELKNLTNNQETRIALLEQRLDSCHSMIPANLSEDVTLLKSQIGSYQKFTWALTTGLLGVFVKFVFDAMTS